MRPQRFEFGKKYKFRLCGYGLFSYLSKVCFAAIGACAFSVRGFGCAPFYMPMGENMDKNIQKKVIDITGIELTPGEPTVCLGNGEQGFECCCDECDCYLLCFTDFNPKNKERNIAENKVYIK